jgi:hypothetical protein
VSLALQIYYFVMPRKSNLVGLPGAVASARFCLDGLARNANCADLRHPQPTIYAIDEIAIGKPEPKIAGMIRRERRMHARSECNLHSLCATFEGGRSHAVNRG